MKRKSKHRQVFPRKKSTQTPWKIEPTKEVDSLEEITRESLSCSICMDYLSVPQTTPCGHVFCYLCIYKWLEQDPICPQCRKSVDSPPYPVYILANQVDQALLKYPDPASTLRIGKDLEYYKSFKEPWCDLYSSSLFFDDNMYSSSSEDDDHLQNVSGFRIIPADSDTTSDDNSDSDTSSASIEPRSVNSNAVVHTGRNSFQDRLDFSADPILVGAQIAAGYTADMITAFNAEHAAFLAADQYPDDCSSVSNDESSHDETLVSRTFVEPQELEPPEIPPEPPQVQDEPARPRRSRRLRKMSKLKISLAGDAMLGRMVDQLQEVHLSSADGDITSKYLKHLKEQHPELSSVDQHYPLGNLLSELQNSDVNVVNLETAITTQSNPVRKTFNFRMHPQNAEILKIANISYVSLANNHILDFGKNGLIDTMHHLAKSDIAFAGVGKSKSEAICPTFKYIKGIKFAFLSASDCKSWECFPEFNYQNVQSPDCFGLSAAVKAAKENADFVIFSFHWGPNHQWFPDADIRRLGRLLIDFGVDLIHGHSSHHIQGIEIYKGKPIFYGMGNFVDDYAVDAHYRNGNLSISTTDLSFIYQAEYNIYEDDLANIKDCIKTFKGWEIPGFYAMPGSFNAKKTLCLSKLTLIPTKISMMQVNRIFKDCSDLNWLYSNMSRLCFDLGTTIELSHDTRGHPVFNVFKKNDIKH